jgi:hypothetical protein
MEPIAPRPSAVTTILAWMALGILALGVVGAEAVLVQSAREAARLYPEFAHLEAPLVTAALVFGVCIEVILVITGLLVWSIPHERIFDRDARRLVDALVIALIAATLVVASTLPFLPGPPALVLAVLGGIIAGTAVTLVVLNLRSLLREASLMRLELDEVV